MSTYKNMFVEVKRVMVTIKTNKHKHTLEQNSGGAVRWKHELREKNNVNVCKEA